MTRPIIRSPAALDDLAEISLFIADDSVAAADRFIDEIDAQFARLSRWPKSGRPRDDLQPEFRSLSHGSYVIYYREAADGIEIVRVLHGARDINRTFGGENETSRGPLNE